MTIRKYIIISCIALLVAGCKGRPQQEPVKEGKAEPAALLFPHVRVPSMMGTEAERTAFLAGHYWDPFFGLPEDGHCDSLTVNGLSRTEMEQEFANYAGILGMTTPDQAFKSVSALWKRVLELEKRQPSSNVFETMVEFAGKYFYDANSPMRDEDLYLPFAEGMAAYEGIGEAERGRYAFDAQMCSLNRVGTKAHDFRFKDAKGKVRNLYSLKEDDILLFFSNPGCQACKEIIENLRNSPSVTELLASGRLAVVNMYIDEELENWREYMPVYPEEWYNVYDPDYIIRTDLTYNVRAIPSLYLLDRNKTVLLKDATADKVFWYLLNNLQ